jgi:hypothetical protein
MIEALGLGVAAEVPLVVVDVMRTGPSTGIATKSEQADLDIALHGLHGDAPTSWSRRTRSPTASPRPNGPSASPSRCRFRRSSCRTSTSARRAPWSIFPT